MLYPNKLFFWWYDYFLGGGLDCVSLSKCVFPGEWGDEETATNFVSSLLLSTWGCLRFIDLGGTGIHVVIPFTLF